MKDGAKPARVERDGKARRATYDEIEVGASLGEMDWVVTEEMIEQQCRMDLDYDEFYSLDSPWGGRIAPPQIQYRPPRWLLSRAYNVRGLFYRWKMENVRPIRLNENLRVRASIVDKYVRNDREFIVLAAEATDAQGRVVFRTERTHVLDKLGLDYASLCAVKPDIIMASLSAFGQEGPQSQYVGYGPSLDAWSGLCSLNCYPDGPPQALGGMFPDTASALYACFAILAALRERDATRRGCHIDLSELETAALLLADVLVRFPSESVPQDWIGNADPYVVPLGAYPCAGEDRWVVVAVEDESAWAGLCAVLGRPQWAEDAAFATPALRKQNLAPIEDALRSWTRSRSAESAFKELQEHGVPSGQALNVAELLADEQLSDRRFFRTVAHPETGEQTIYAPIWRFDGVVGDLRPAPLLGQDSENVREICDVK